MRKVRSPREVLVRRMVVAHGTNARDWAQWALVQTEASKIVDTLTDQQVTRLLKHPLPVRGATQ